MQMLRPHLIVAALAFTMLACAPSPQANKRGLLAADDSRDLILVSVDTLRASRLPFYSQTLHSAPRLELAGSVDESFSMAWLASQGVVYDSAFTTAGKTLPSLASFFTGLAPIEHGAVSNMTRLQADTYVSKLKLAGFKSHARVANRSLHKFCGLAEGFDTYAVRAKQRESELGDDLLSAAHDDIASSKRVMLWAHFMAPHQPYEPLPEYRSQLSLPAEIVAGNEQLQAAHRSPQTEQHHFGAYRDLYDAEIATSNQYVQNFLSKLDAQYRAANRGGLLDNAVVVFFSDHGEELADRNGYFLHAKSLYSSVVQVPLIIIDKKSGRKGHVTDLVDLSQTMKMLLEGDEFTSDFVVSAWHNDFFAIRDNRYTLVHNPQQNALGPLEPPEDVAYFYSAVELYDRQNDPFELNNIAAQHPQIVARLGEQLYQWYNSKSLATSDPSSYLDEQTLAELGYTEDPNSEHSLDSLGPWSAEKYDNNH
jgi:arylsulfatase A-like enzyme